MKIFKVVIEKEMVVEANSIIEAEMVAEQCSGFDDNDGTATRSSRVMELKDLPDLYQDGDLIPWGNESNKTVKEILDV